MDYKKVPQQINDVVGDNVKKLAQLFPSAVKDGEVDFEALKEELGSFTEVGAEKYELTWAGKADAKRIAREDIVGKTLKYVPEDSKDADTTENLYIEGDNLEVLKLLRQNYYGAIKMIYIDPPYNTGNDFIYNDSFDMSQEESDIAEGNTNELGERFAVNSGTGNRYHANWLSMMYPRLIIAKDLLSDDGAIFISIDDNESDNLKKICDEIFGESCFVANISWRKTYSPRNDAHGISSEAEHILVYSKMPNWQPNKLPRTEKMDSVYKNPDNDHTMWRTSDAFAPSAATHQGMVYAIQQPITGELIYPYNGACWPLEQGKMLEQMLEWAEYELKDIGDDERRAQVCGISVNEIRKNVKAIVLSEPLESAKEKSLAIMERGQWPKFFFTKNGYGGIARKTYLDDTKGKVVTNYWSYEEVGHTDGAKKEIKSLFDERAPFDTPKPTKLLERILHIATDKNSFVLDFFAGSATTAHAVFNKNLEDKGNRKFIMIQLPEQTKSPVYPTLCEIGKERIRRAGEKIKSEHPDADIDIGFKVFRVADTNIKWNSLMDMGQLDVSQIESTPDLMDFMPNTKDIDVVYELILRQRDVALSETVELLSDIGSRTYLYASSFLVCLETEVTESLVEKIAAIDPLPIKFIFRDSAFKDDIALKDETFRRLKALVEKNSGESKPTYTVEFI